MSGQCREALSPTGVWLWTDVRDLALAHVKAAELPDAANKRFFIVTGLFSNKMIAEIIRENFPERASKLPEGDGLEPGDFPEGGTFSYDNKRAVEVLGLKFRSLKESIVDTVKSLEALGA